MILAWFAMKQSLLKLGTLFFQDYDEDVNKIFEEVLKKKSKKDVKTRLEKIEELNGEKTKFEKQIQDLKVDREKYIKGQEVKRDKEEQKKAVFAKELERLKKQIDKTKKPYKSEIKKLKKQLNKLQTEIDEQQKAVDDMAGKPGVVEQRKSLQQKKIKSNAVESKIKALGEAIKLELDVYIVIAANYARKINLSAR